MKLSHFLIAFSLLLMFACTKDETGNNSESIKGTWKVESVEIIGNNKVNSAGIEVETSFNLSGENLDYSLTFEETKFKTEGSYNFVGNVKIGEQEIPQNQSFSDVMGNGTYSVSGDSLTVTGSFFSFDVNGVDMSGLEASSQTVFIEKLTDTELILSSEQNITQNVSGVSAIQELNSRSVWKKQ